jgi:hypothetical protein
MSKVIDIHEHKKKLNDVHDVEISFIYGEGDICRALRKALNDAEMAQEVEEVFCDLLFAAGEPCPDAARDLLADLLSRQESDP